MKLAHAQSTNIAKKGFVAIEVDFLARALERMLRATMQNIPHLRSTQVHMSNLDCIRRGPAHSTTLPKIFSENPEMP